MRDGVCPKCGSQSVYKNTNIGEFSSRRKHDAIWVDESLMSKRALPIIYVCAGCGYVEHYVDDAEFLERIQQKWHKA
jgi:predicted nucleic-acid-binding Zn-ribbon protein